MPKTNYPAMQCLSEKNIFARWLQMRYILSIQTIIML